jgi:hypothetical protein
VGQRDAGEGIWVSAQGRLAAGEVEQLGHRKAQFDAAAEASIPERGGTPAGVRVRQQHQRDDRTAEAGVVLGLQFDVQVDQLGPFVDGADLDQRVEPAVPDQRHAHRLGGGLVEEHVRARPVDLSAGGGKKKATKSDRLRMTMAFQGAS